MKQMKQNGLLSVSRMLALVSAVLVSSVRAGTFTWNGGAEGNWSDTANWLCDGAPATVLPTDADKVDLKGVKATIVLTENVDVGYFWAFQEGSEITVRSGTPGTQYALSVKKSWEGALGGYGGGFPGYMSDGVKLTLDGVRLYPNYEGNAASEWGLNTSLVNFRNPGTIEITNGGLYVGKLGTWSTLSLVLHSSTLWIREYDSVAGLDVVLDDSTWSGFQKEIAVAGDLSVTFAGTAPQLKAVGNASVNPNVSGTTTFKYVLPASPYAASPVVNEGAVNFAPAGDFKIEIDAASPALTSGALQTYRLMSYAKDTGHGLNLQTARYPTMRTTKEVFQAGYAPGADTAGLPQYLDLTVDGAYDPSSAVLDVSFNAPRPSDAGEVFSGFVNELGQGASSATVTVKYGTDESLSEEAELGDVAEAGSFSFTLAAAGLSEEATYYYQLVISNDQGESVQSDVSTFSLSCGSVLANKVDVSLDNGRATIGGSLDIVGSGATTVKLLVGRSATTLGEVATQEVTTDAFAFDYVFADEGEWWVKFECANVKGGKAWSDTSSVAPYQINVSDTCVYTWKGGDGNWTNAACWTCSAVGAGLGYPTSQSEAVFPVDVEAAVTLPHDVAVAKLTAMSAGSRVTFVGDGVGLIASSITASGADAELTLDGVTLTDSVNIWNIAWKFEPGENSVLKLRHAAAVQAKLLNPQADGPVLDLSGGSTAFFRETGNANTVKVILDDSTLEVPDHVLNFSEFVFRGASPAAKVCNLADIPITLTYELPEAPYAEAPLRQSTMLPSSLQDLDQGALTVVISPDSPARRSGRRGEYPLIGWDAAKKSGDVDTVFGIDTSRLVAVEGKKGRDEERWGRKEGAASLEKPQYLLYELTRSRGMTMYVR